MQLLLTWLLELMRKFAFGAGMVWLIAALSRAGASQDEIKRWVEITSALIIVLLSAMWSRFVKPWLCKKFPALEPMLNKLG